MLRCKDGENTSLWRPWNKTSKGSHVALMAFTAIDSSICWTEKREVTGENKAEGPARSMRFTTLVWRRATVSCPHLTRSLSAVTSPADQVINIIFIFCYLGAEQSMYSWCKCLVAHQKPDIADNVRLVYISDVWTPLDILIVKFQKSCSLTVWLVFPGRKKKCVHVFKHFHKYCRSKRNT